MVYGEGFKACTIKGRKGFNPVFSKFKIPQGRKTTGRAALGARMKQEIEAFMVDNPGKQMPGSEIAKKYGYNPQRITQIAKEIEKAGGFSRRNRGGARLKTPDNAMRTIERIYKQAKPGSRLKVLDLIREIARIDKEVISPQSAVKILRAMEKKWQRGIRITQSGLNVAQIIRMLKAEGINARSAHSLYNVQGR